MGVVLINRLGVTKRANSSWAARWRSRSSGWVEPVLVTLWHRLDGFHHGGQVIGLRGLFAGVAQAVQTFQGNTFFLLHRAFLSLGVSGWIQMPILARRRTHRLRSSGGRAAGRQQSRHTVWFSGMRPLRVYLW